MIFLIVVLSVIAWYCFYIMAILLLEEEKDYPKWVKKVLRIK